MKNPLKFYHNLLFNSSAINPATLISAEDEKISLLDNDITDRIKMEIGKVYLDIDEEFWKGSNTENEFFLTKLLNISKKLIDISCKQIESHIEQVIKPQNMDYWLMVYNNTQCVYENLLTIHNHVLSYYCSNTNAETHEIIKKKYPFLLMPFVETLRKKCIANIGKIDTEFIINSIGEDFNIIVKTSALPPLSTVLPIEKSLESHAELINVLERKSPAQIIQWQGTAKEFIHYFFPMLEKNLLTIIGHKDRTSIVNALFQAFYIKVKDKASNLEKRVSPETLQSYFKKEASGESY